jgi:hypothetical protein
MWRFWVLGFSVVLAVAGVAGARDVSPLARRLKMPEIEVAWQKVRVAHVTQATERRGQQRVEPAAFELIRYFQEIESAADLDAALRTRAGETLRLLRVLEREARLSDGPGMQRAVRALQRACDSCHEAAGLKKS